MSNDVSNDKNHSPHIGFVGGGNMASSLIGGLLADGTPKEQIHVFEPNSDARAKLAADFQVQLADSNEALVAACDVVVLAVKPQVLHDVCAAMADSVQTSKPLVLSIAAGIRGRDISKWLGGDVAVVRTMPNTPSLVQSGAAGMVANARVSDVQKNLAESLMRAVGIAVWLENEEQLDAVTAVSGSGPAYYFLMMEAMQAAGQSLGLDEKSARLLTLQTAFGAAKMALESGDDPALLRQRVTSPNGTTERALESFEANGFRSIVKNALQAANDRSAELADELAGQHADRLR